MTTNSHTPLAFGGPLTSVAMEAPLGQLDAAIAAVIVTGSGTSTTLTAQANAAQASLTVASSAGFAPGDPIYIGTGATFESRIIATVPGGGVTITVTVNLSNTYAIGQPVSKSPVEIVDARGGLTTLGARLATMETSVNVKRYGAKGDGATDDSAAFQAAHDALPASGGAIFIPPGTYVGGTTMPLLTISKSGIRLVGAGSGLSILKYANASASKYLIAATAANLTDMHFEGFAIDGNATNNGTMTQAEGMHIVGGGSKRISLNDIYVYDIKGTSVPFTDESMALNIAYCTSVTISNCRTENNGGTGLSLMGVKDAVVTNYTAINNGSGGTGCSTVGATICENITFSNVVVQGCGRIGINFESVVGLTLSNIVIDRCGTYGMAFNVSVGAPTTYTRDVEGSGIVIRSNGTTAAGTYPGIVATGIADGPSRLGSDMTTTNGSTTVTSPTAAFVAGDVGKTLNIAGYIFTIATYVNATTVTISSAFVGSGTWYWYIAGGGGPMGCRNIHLSGVRAFDDQTVKTQSFGVTDGTGSSNCTFDGDFSGNLTGESGLEVATNRYHSARRIRAKVYNSAVVSVPNATFTAMTWNLEEADSDGLHSIVTNTDRITIPAGLAGEWEIEANPRWAASAVGERVAFITVNGDTIAADGMTGGGEGQYIRVTKTLAANDVISLTVYQASGGALNFVAGSWLQATRL